MKTKILIFTGLLFCSLNNFGQHPLVGTWKMVSMKGIDYNGNAISLNTSNAREIKIITPTHFMTISHDVKDDSLIFKRSHGGTVSMDRGQYIETPTIASWQNLKSVGTTFSWKVDGDKFTQSGTITRNDGKTFRVEALVFQKVKVKKSYPKNPTNGTWDQLSSSYKIGDGEIESHTKETATRFQVTTPTHWMRISHRDKKFESANAGTYTMKGGKVYPVIEWASYPIKKPGMFEFTQRLEGDKLYVSGKAVMADGITLSWDDIFQKVGGANLE